MQDSRLYSLDFLKFVAALMITNSHFQPLYEDVSPSLATYFHYVCHFSVMVMGGLCYLLRDKVKCSSIMRDMLWMIVSFIAYFVILKIGKGAMGIRYDIQITALIPLHIFVYLILFSLSTFFSFLPLSSWLLIYWKWWLRCSWQCCLRKTWNGKR